MVVIDWQLILDYLKVFIWPVIVAGSIIYFRKKVADLIDRITIIKGPGGTEIRAAEQKKVIESQKEVSDDGSLRIKETFKSEIDEIKENLEAALEKEKKAAENKDKIINSLLDQLSFKTLQLDFEVIYRTIFGSQIDLLKRLGIKDLEGEESRDAIFFFVLTTRIFPVLKEWSFTQYLAFLFNAGLIYTKDSRYLITDKGKAFLSYIEILKYPKKDL